MTEPRNRFDINQFCAKKSRRAAHACGSIRAAHAAAHISGGPQGAAIRLHAHLPHRLDAGRPIASPRASFAIQSLHAAFPTELSFFRFGIAESCGFRPIFKIV
ncbi:hypothetical protein BVI1335_3650002 [Burkholderia vietnamiensis]|nr:hypothetical protein BVI1335_3650002 [Burkholderia vietnamiensis]